MNRNGLPYGQATMTMEDGRQAQGIFYEGRLVNGSISYEDGLIEEGFFLNLVLHGQGKRKFPNGKVQEGLYQQGELVDDSAENL